MIFVVVREYERTITAVVAGYVQPQVAYYLSSLQTVLKEAGANVEPMITKSNGGVMTAERVRLTVLRCYFRALHLA